MRGNKDIRRSIFGMHLVDQRVFGILTLIVASRNQARLPAARGGSAQRRGLITLTTERTMQSSADLNSRYAYVLVLALATAATITPLAAHAGAPVFGPVGSLSDKAPTGAQLCSWLPVAKVNMLLHTSRTQNAGDYTCHYVHKTNPDIDLHASGFKSSDALTKWIGKQGGKALPSPAGTLLYSLGFDMKKQKISGVWFMSHGSPVELGFNDGRDDHDAVLALVAAAK